MKQNILILTLCCLVTHSLFSCQDSTQTGQYNTALTNQLQATFDTVTDQNYQQHRIGMKTLVENGANPNVEKEKSPLLEEATRLGDFELARCLVAHKANVNHLTREGLNLLHKAINRRAEPSIFAFLCNAGTDPNQKIIANQNAPLHYLFILSKFNRDPLEKVKEKASILIWAGADDQSENAKGETPLIIPDNFDFITQMMALGTVIPQVKAAVMTEEAQRRQAVVEALTKHVPVGPANLVVDYTRK